MIGVGRIGIWTWIKGVEGYSASWPIDCSGGLPAALVYIPVVIILITVYNEQCLAVYLHYIYLFWWYTYVV